ncbi:MAG: NAD(+)/NADH kinase, partial [Anaerolineales bacterium]|nr:NAD(+)/NADH kinase [Anaerolineales bacterium]
MQTTEKIGKVALLGHRDVKDTARLAAEVAEFLQGEGVACEREGLREIGDVISLDPDTDLIVALGGDGTMLRAGALAAEADVPIMGINLGRVGFLMEVHRDGWREAFRRLFEGDFWLEPRMRVKIELQRGDETFDPLLGLNECVVGRGRTARPIRLRAEVDGRYLATYVADALICSTATGSTGYALAAGGPILPPQLRNLLLIPVAPHLSFDREIVLPEGSKVRMKVLSEHEAN